MKKQTIIILILCILLIAVIAFSVLGHVGPQGSPIGYTGVPTVSPPNTIPNIGTSWDHSYPTSA